MPDLTRFPGSLVTCRGTSSSGLQTAGLSTLLAGLGLYPGQFCMRYLGCFLFFLCLFCLFCGRRRTQLRHDRVKIERCCLLPWRILDEVVELLLHDGLGKVKVGHMVE